MDYQKDLERAKSQYKDNRRFLEGMRRTKPRNLDDRFREVHEAVFREVDCLACANCCKTTSPIFISSDIDRLSKSLKMHPRDFIRHYLKIDDEGDHVLKQAPCPFLGNDNRCIVYEDRPRACREYPHTNRKRMYQITRLTLKNTMVCPAASRIVDRLRTLTGK